ncbi:M56 family metallopeptidase, partial [Archangium sp.]|uniref:M56 family metallopeptidase n=1 Tax=Archangium sp. TaxID=1872627 RepID=UPI00389A99E9
MSALDVHAVMETGLGVLGTLWQATWQGALWALVVWALTRALPKLPASVRTSLWWLVGLKCLVGLCAPGAVRLPLLPAAEAPVALVEKAAPAPSLAHARPEGVKSGGGALPVVHAPEREGTRLGWTPLLLGALLLWLGGIAWQGRELLQGLVQLRRLRREARPLEDASLHQAAVNLGRELGLARVPPLLVSEHAPGPLALGLLRPEVILPRKALETLSPPQQRMALAHELAHVRRGDLWLGWVPALARAVFFFHPLVRRACQEYALAREEACDAAALQATGAAPREYGRLLLVFGVARAPAAAAASGASSHLAALKRRIAMLEHAESESKHRHRWVRWTLGGLALVALVPFQVVARETPAPVPAVPAVPQAPRAAAAAQPAQPVVQPLVPAVVLPVVKPVAPAARVAVAQPAAPVAPVKPPMPPSVHEDDEDGRYSYVLLRGSDDATMSGSTQDLKVARHLAGDSKQPLLYVRRDDGQEFVIRDAATLKAFEDTFKAVREIGDQQGKLGEQMGELGGKQGELGGKQGEFGAKMGELGEKLGTLGRKQGKIAHQLALLELDDDAEETPDLKRQREQLEHEQKELENQMEELEKQMEPFNEQMEKLGEEMEKYSEPMEKLGEQMEKFGEQMEKASHEAQQKA